MSPLLRPPLGWEDDGVAAVPNEGELPGYAAVGWNEEDDELSEIAPTTDEEGTGPYGTVTLLDEEDAAADVTVSSSVQTYE